MDAMTADILRTIERASQIAKAGEASMIAYALLKSAEELDTRYDDALRYIESCGVIFGSRIDQAPDFLDYAFLCLADEALQ